MPVRRQHPYIWATWLPRLLTGDNSCEWSVWFKAHYQDWAKQPSDFNQAQWMLNHTALLNERRANWEVGGYSVEVEGQNSFQLRGRSATLSGKPDLIARREDDVAFVDAKAGHESPSHAVQLMIYLYAVPKALEKYRNARLRGQVTYGDHTVRIPAEAVDDQFVQNLGALIRRISNDEPARRVPSKQECRFCDITAADCPQRADGDVETQEGTTSDFRVPSCVIAGSRDPWDNCRRLPAWEPFPRAADAHTKPTGITMKLLAAAFVLIAAMIIACSSETTPPPAQPSSGTATEATPAATTVTTEVPTVVTPVEVPVATREPQTEPSPLSSATPAVPSTTEVPTPQATSVPLSPLPASTNPAPVPTLTAIHTSELNILKVTIAEVRTNLPEYDRDDWKHWTDADRDCQDARNEVLVAESRAAVAYRTDKKCRVATGEWLAPYTGTFVTDPSKLDVDHMVPLGNAHRSGSWRWSAEEREQYANYLNYPQHLIAVTASANRSKGARGPDQWKPEDRTYWCQYAADWITIKDT